MKNLYYSILTLLLFSGCATVYFDPSISVPEEGGVNFTKLNEEGERIAASSVTSTVPLKWYAASSISLSRDSSTIAYLGVSNKFVNVYSKSLKGGRSVTQKTFNRNVGDICFSPNGEKMVFSAIQGNNYNIYMINTEGGAAVQQLAASSADEQGAVFSPDGKKIYYSKIELGRPYIWSIDLESSLQTQYTEGFTPKPLRDGKRILITRNSKDGQSRGEIWLIDLEKGTESCILSDPKIGFSSPDISPDNNTIVCVGSTPKSQNKPDNLDLYTFRLDGSHLKQQTFHGGHDLSPQWSADGRAIFFISQRGNNTGEYNLWKMNYRN